MQVQLDRLLPFLDIESLCLASNPVLKRSRQLKLLSHGNRDSSQSTVTPILSLILVLVLFEGRSFFTKVSSWIQVLGGKYTSSTCELEQCLSPKCESQSFPKNVWSESKADGDSVWRHHCGSERHLQATPLATWKGNKVKTRLKKSPVKCNRSTTTMTSTRQCWRIQTLRRSPWWWWWANTQLARPHS